jgi:type II secretory pathway component HofQ
MFAAACGSECPVSRGQPGAGSRQAAGSSSSNRLSPRRKNLSLLFTVPAGGILVEVEAISQHSSGRAQEGVHKYKQLQIMIERACQRINFGCVAQNIWQAWGQLGHARAVVPRA